MRLIKDRQLASYITLSNYAMHCVLAYPRQLIQKTLKAEKRCCYLIYMAKHFVTELFKTKKN